MGNAPTGSSLGSSPAIRHSRRLARALRFTGASALRLPLSVFRPGSIAMFHVGRSGSTVLGNLLDQHPKITWDGEIYAPYRLGWRKRGGEIEPGGLAIDPAKMLRARRIRAGKNFYGFEVKFFHLKLAGVALSDYVERVRRLGVSHFIILERENYLKVVVSSLVGHDLSRFHQSSREKATLNRVEIDVDDVRIDRDAKPLISYLEDYRESFGRLQELLGGLKVLRLTYEDDILADPLEGYGRVCDFLGVDRHPVSVRFGRTNPFDLSEMIVNFGEVERALRGTRFEWMLYE